MLSHLDKMPFEIHTAKEVDADAIQQLQQHVQPGFLVRSKSHLLPAQKATTVSTVPDQPACIWLKTELCTFFGLQGSG